MPPRDPDGGDPPVVVAWNAKVGRGRRTVARNLRDLLRDHPDAEALLLQEFENYTRWVRLRFALTWRVYARHGWDEAANCPVMVRRSTPRGKRRGKGWGAVRCAVGWVFFPRNARHPGRTWTWVNARGIPLLSVHRAWSPLDRNAKAGAAEAEALVDWFAEHPGPAFAAGDMNHAPDNPHGDASLRIAREVKGEVVGPRRIDHGIARGLRVKATRGEKYGSDHACVRYELTITG